MKNLTTILASASLVAIAFLSTTAAEAFNPDQNEQTSHSSPAGTPSAGTPSAGTPSAGGTNTGTPATGGTTPPAAGGTTPPAAGGAGTPPVDCSKNAVRTKLDPATNKCVKP